MLWDEFTEGVYLVDFEFHPVNCKEGNPPFPVCMVVREWPPGLTTRYWHDELHEMNSAPFPTGEKALWVAYYASAEMDCFKVLGWALPVNLLDLFVELCGVARGARH